MGLSRHSGRRMQGYLTSSRFHQQVKEGTAKKMSAVNSRSFNRMKNKLKRHNQNHTAEIAKYRQVSITSHYARTFSAIFLSHSRPITIPLLDG